MFEEFDVPPATVPVPDFKVGDAVALPPFPDQEIGIVSAIGDLEWFAETDRGCRTVEIREKSGALDEFSGYIDALRLEYAGDGILKASLVCDDRKFIVVPVVPCAK